SCHGFRLLISASSHSGRGTLSLHDALPICGVEVHLVGTTETSRDFARSLGFEVVASVEEIPRPRYNAVVDATNGAGVPQSALARDRKSTRLNSSHVSTSYAVFCLKKKNRKT